MSSIPNTFRKLSGAADITKLKSKKTALLLIEFQSEHFTGALPVEEAETLLPCAVKMMDWADKHKILSIHVRHLAKSPASPVFAPQSNAVEFYPPVVPRKNHLVETKYASSIFSGSGIHTVLQSHGIDTLILTGMSTPSTISASAHDACHLGYTCLLAADLTASRDVVSWDATRVISGKKMQETALANIADKYAQVMLSTNIMALPVEK